MAAIPILQRLIVPATSKHTATVIFVHGLGDSGHGWKPVAEMFGADQQLQHVKWVLPHAPVEPVTANQGMRMPSWFDIIEFGFKSTEDEKGMLKTASSLNKLISEEVDAGIDPSRIILGGFSQGGTMSLLTGLTNERKLGGLIVLSAWLPLRHKIKAMTSDHAKSIPIFWGQGKQDELIRPALSKLSVEFVKNELGFAYASSQTEATGVAYKQYNGVGHSVNDQELADLKAWIKNAIPPTKA
ncbi:lysophospholipase I [Coprinopsis marcescibilis]|uniref:Acyl-protein thioesterase 1 n=1 Tax=Coprinopsis marcescibilis TaxID=230819 RepID=A0A5C3L1G1_COPMA|nr:lysophospholipase I [Coprinopsis marcescibilis]